MNKRSNSRSLLLVGGGADRINVRYACGFDAPDPFLYVEAKGQKHLLVSMLELGRAQQLGEAVQTHTHDSLGLKPKERRSLGQQALGLLKHLGLKRIQVSADCPIGVVRELEKAEIKVRVAKAPLYPERLVKTDKEIEFLRASQRAAVSAMKAAIGMIEASDISAEGHLLQQNGEVLTAEIVRHQIERVLLDADCIAEDIIVACGDQAVDPHERGYGPLYAHQFIVLDIFPCSKTSGYWGDITRTVLRGGADPMQTKLYKTVLKAQKEALASVKPGANAKEIHQRIFDRFVAAGFVTGMKDGVPQGFIHSTGHGVGLEIHEGPSVSPAGTELEVGQVITIEPGLYYRGLGGVRIEDTVVVTEKGCSALARCSKEWRL
ncbi:Xaa-Pro peptidase family protein [Kiritimatiellota bacterium B12222]|nr:Xaa-Pro peptidase family protein [Kiritimatiellota bacterium B12222]